MSEFDDTRASSSNFSNPSSKTPKSNFNKTTKIAYLNYISEGIRHNKRFSEIVKDVQERFGSTCFAKNTIPQWVAALKTSKRKVAERQLGSSWMHYWYALHSDSDDESIRVESIQTARSFTDEAGLSMADEENDELPDVIEIKQEPAEEFLRLPSKNNRASLIEPDSTSQILKRKPRRILGKATLNGQTYFMVKWKGSYEEELGML